MEEETQASRARRDWTETGTSTEWPVHACARSTCVRDNELKVRLWERSSEVWGWPELNIKCEVTAVR